MPTNLNWRGPWTNSNTYQVGDCAQYRGSTYIAININTYVVPDVNPLSWQLLASQGVQGIQGVPGPTGTLATAGTAGITIIDAGDGVTVRTITVVNGEILITP